MAWIELHQSLITHKKTRRLTRKLGLEYPAELPETIGHLCLFWLWCVDGTENGDLTDLDAQDIADAAGWTGDPETFFGAMKETGFIEDVDGKVMIHDWRDYIGKLLERREESREKERNRKRDYRQRMKAKQTENPTEDYSLELDMDSIDPEWLKVVQCYEHNIGLIPNGSALDELQQSMDKLGADVICEAIVITNKAQADNPWKYLRKIMLTWEEKGIDTLEKAQAYTKDLARRLESAKKRRQPEASEPPAISGSFY